MDRRPPGLLVVPDPDLELRAQGSQDPLPGTFLGWIWSLVLPLATLMVYTVVFSVVFRAQPPPFGNGRTGIYSVWLFVGLVAWQFLAHGINTAVPSLMSAGRLLQKIYIPSYVPVIGSLVATALQSAVELGLVLLILLILGNVGVSWLVLPVILAFYFVFVTSVSLALSIAERVHARSAPRRRRGAAVALLRQRGALPGGPVAGGDVGPADARHHVAQPGHRVHRLPA